MLCELHVRNFVIIDRLSISFTPGFNVLTGETGAGKSIIIDAIALILGGKARPELIRNGEDEAAIEAVFDLAVFSGVCELLDDAAIPHDKSLLVRRIISRSGKNRIYLNDSISTVAQLQNLLPRMVSIYGQHEQLGLMRAENHLGLLDLVAETDTELKYYRLWFDECRAIKESLGRFESSERDRQQRLDLLAFQSQELHNAALQKGEDEILSSERVKCLHAEKLSIAAENGYSVLYAGEQAVCERLSQLIATLKDLAKIDPSLGEMIDPIENAYYPLEDVALQLRNYREKLTYDSERLDQVEARLGLLASLKRKYGSTIEEMQEYLAKCEAELRDLTDIDNSRELLTRKLVEAEQQLQEIGCRISSLRKTAAVNLQTRVEAELSDLAMGKSRFIPKFFPLTEPGGSGLERVEFYLQTNPGEEEKPLARIASGGELSRIMLAIRRAAPRGEESATLIFDEVDAGIGGAAATAVGEKLRNLALGRQVLCITHLPQVAAFGDSHLQVNKLETTDGRTRIEVCALDCDERVKEVARMLGGAKVTEQSLAHARELISLSYGNERSLT